ncbi:hypothetical protein V8E53_001880 [Lactarius tabidus]
MSTLPDYFDNDDSPFADDPASGDDTFSSPLVLQHSHLNQCCVHAPPTTVSGTSASSLRSDPMQMPPPLSVPSAPPKSSGLSPGAITKIPLAELFHNPEFLKEHERANSLQHMVTLLVAELVDLQHLNKFKLMIVNPSPHTLALSLSPSDLMSHATAGHAPSNSLAPCSLIHPDNLLLSVLWMWEDCVNDLLVGITKDNQSQLPMHWAIRTECGIGITTLQWKWKANMTLGLVLSGDIIPSRPLSPSHLCNLHGTLGPQTQGTSVGSKHKHSCKSSLQQQCTKKAEKAEKGDSNAQFAPSPPEFLNMANFKNITVHPSAHDLICLFKSDFKRFSGSVDLIQAMDEVTDIESHKLSNDIAVLLDRINTADPDLPDIDKDDSNENWGHAQFTAGGLTIQSTLVDWEAPTLPPAAGPSGHNPTPSKSASPEPLPTDPRLLHTECNPSKLLHSKSSPKWAMLACAGKANQPAPTDDKDDDKGDAAASLESEDEDPKSKPSGDAGESAEGLDVDEEQLGTLKVEELVLWIKKHKILGKHQTKDDAIHSILNAPTLKHPSMDNIKTIINKHTSKTRAG